MGRWTQSGWVALGLSLLVHLGVLALVFSFESTPVSRPTPKPHFIEASVVIVEPQETPPPPKVPETAPPSAPPRAPVRRGAPTKSVARAPEPSAPTPEAPADDAPRHLRLGDERAEPSSTDESFAEFTARTNPGGRTIRPGDGPSQAEIDAENVARGEALIDGFARATVRRYRAQNGIVSPEYDEVRQTLSHATKDVPDLIGLDDPKAVSRSLVEAWQTGAEQYAKTGAPYETPAGWNERFERPSSLVEAAQRGSPAAQELLQFFAAGARLQEFADGRAGKELVAFVSVLQGPDGALLSAELAQPSGVSRFDDWVMETTRSSLGRFRLDAGARSTPLTSTWQFTGRVSFMKKGAAPSPRSITASIPLFVLSALTGGRVPVSIGRFDEVTGETESLDLSSPHYQVNVTLLEAE